MKAKVLGILILMFLILPVRVAAHSGRTDSNGGHNCNVGSCAGTYHYHNGGSYTPPPRQPVVTTRTMYEVETIQFQVVEENNADLLIGQKQIVREGVNGQKTHTFKVTYTDGVQTSKQLISSAVTTDATNMVIAMGTKEEQAFVAAATTTNTGTPEKGQSASTGDALSGLAVLTGISYGVFRLGKFGLTKIRSS